MVDEDILQKGRGRTHHDYGEITRPVVLGAIDVVDGKVVNAVAFAIQRNAAVR